MAAVGEDDANSGPPKVHAPAEESGAGLLIRFARRSHAGTEQQAESVNEDMTFAAFHPLVAIKASHAAATGSARGLRIHDGDRGARMAPAAARASMWRIR